MRAAAAAPGLLLYRRGDGSDIRRLPVGDSALIGVSRAIWTDRSFAAAVLAGSCRVGGGIGSTVWTDAGPCIRVLTISGAALICVCRSIRTSSLART